MSNGTRSAIGSIAAIVSSIVSDSKQEFPKMSSHDSFLIGGQFLDARVLQHANEMRRDVGKAWDVHSQPSGATAGPIEMGVRGVHGW